MVQLDYLLMFSLVGFSFSIFTLCLQYKHLLGALLSLEAMTLGLFVGVFSISSMFNVEGYMCLILITLGACEASLGLAVLVSLIRTHGNDYVFNYSLHKC
uniref:NADH dehydrogenase subunit 4L n=1 Tax=Perotrochus quoyanus TaxID=160002 RepID=UPI001E6E72D7|nr:NADH dehydrogenase subunit 4L [Perotrochus quoyanus]YP_010381783.1 NADH dehydrogenase subunit 4L [Perotrochus charlestonensis]UDL72158.1 NADH dehydrogenase subunit 4L [Perotrochus quoyanus]UDL72171.1 NADH dehydrogenase subunit 4L [Perotrochus charlestonensis]